MGLFSIFARLRGDTSDYDRKMRRSMDRTEGTVKKTAARIGGWLAAAFSVGAVVALEKRTLEFGSKVQDLAKRFSVSAEEIQEIAFAAEQSSSSIESLIPALARLNKVRGDILAGKPAEGAGQLLEAMGFGKDELRARNAVQLMRELGTILASDPLNNDRGFIAQLLFGEAGGQLLPVFDAGLGQMADRLRDIGGLMSNERVAQLKEAADALTDIKFQLIGIASEAGPQVLDTLREIVALLRSVRTLSDAVQVNKELKEGPQDNSFSGVVGGMLSTPNRFRSAYNIARLRGIIARQQSGQELRGTIGSGLTPTLLMVQRMMGARRLLAGGAALGGLGGGGPVGGSSIASAMLNFQSLLSGQKTRMSGGDLNAGSLANVGGFVGLGGSRNTQMTWQMDVVNKLDEISRNTDPAEQKTVKLSD